MHGNALRQASVGTLIALGALAGFQGSAAAQADNCPTAIVVSATLPTTPCANGGTGGVLPGPGALFAWNAFIALNWPNVPLVRETPDPLKSFGSGGPVVWETMRAKSELYPGNASQTVGPHGAVVSQVSPYQATNPPDYGYDELPKYLYAPDKTGTTTGEVNACSGQEPVAVPAWVSADETTEIGNNQTFAGVLPATPTADNSQPQLIRYAVKMNKSLYRYIVQSQFWYDHKVSPLQTASLNYTTALAAGTSKNPTQPYVAFPTVGSGSPPGPVFETKSAWRPLTSAEAASGRFYTNKIRYYELTADGTPCFRQAVWGLVGMHVISFTLNTPWVIWATFEQADNILTPQGQPTEDADGKRLVPSPVSPTSPALTSDPSQVAPKVTIKDGQGYCTTPASQLFFRENPHYGTLPAAGNICINGRWHDIPDSIVQVNQAAHAAISSYMSGKGMKSSPWLYYKLVNVQPTPFDKSKVAADTAAMYYSANAVIESDYSLGMFSGDLVKGAPSDVTPAKDGGTQPYYNTTLLPFQSKSLGLGNLNMGGCAGCHGFSATQGTDFSFALGGNAKAPEPPDAFARGVFRDYFGKFQQR